jgi:putative endonuclease
VLSRLAPPLEASPAMSADPRHHLGQLGERVAAEHMVRRGYELLDLNHRTRFGELDLVAYDPFERAIVFCEVKTRRAGSAFAFEAVGPRKQAQVRRLAMAWLSDAQDRPHAAMIRFDVVAVVIDRRGNLISLDHLEGVF